MRLKEDSSNWKASNLTRKIKEIPDQPIYRKKKNTRKWCKGVVGNKHDYQRRENEEKDWPSNYIFIIDKCSKCGKEKYMGIKKVDKAEAS